MQLSDKDQLVINIISDSVIFSRLSESMFKIINVVNDGLPNEFQPKMHYHGCFNGIDLLGIPDDDDELREMLYEIFSSEVEDMKQIKPMEVATTIFYKWSTAIREYYTKLKKAS